MSARVRVMSATAVGSLGVVSAGGASTRYGSPKALALVGGQRVVDRVAGALSDAVGADRVVAIVNDETLARRIRLPHRGDALVGIGALAGVHAAVVWAAERGMAGAIVVGCDMPFVAPGLLKELLARSAGADVVIPCSGGPRGVEPLCAWYGITCRAAIESAVAGGDRRMIAFHDAVRVERIPLDEVSRFGSPERLFLNLNTLADLAIAERLEREG